MRWLVFCIPAACAATIARNASGIARNASGVARVASGAVPPTPFRTQPASEKTAHDQAHEELSKFQDGRPNKIKDILDKGLDRRAAVPHPYENQHLDNSKVKYSNEIQAMSDLVRAAEQDVVKLRHEATLHEDELLTCWIVDYNKAQDAIFHLTACPHPDVKAADKVGLESIASRRNLVKSLLKAESHDWENELEEYLLRSEEMKARADEVNQCIKARPTSSSNGLPSGCDADPVGEVDLRDILEDDANYYGRMTDQSPWEIPRFKTTLEALDEEEKEIQQPNSFWHHSLVRRKRYREGIEDFEETLNAIEGYFDYRHAHVLTKLAGKKDRLCEIDMEPAIKYGAGLIEDDVDLTPLSMLMDEAAMIHSAMEKHRAFHRMELHVLWQSLWMLRTALEDTHVLSVEKDIDCQAKFGTKWWSWSWCRESHKQLLRFTAHDSPDAVNEKMLGLVEVRRNMQRHIMDGKDVAMAADTEVDMKHNIDIEVDYSKTYISELDSELDTVNKRLTERNNLARELQVAQTIPNVVWIKGNVTKLLEKTLGVYQTHLQETMKQSRMFQIKQGIHIIEAVDRKCRRVQDHFYKGGSHDANVNKDAYEQVTSPVAHVFANSSQANSSQAALRAGSVQELTAKAEGRRVRRLHSRLQAELAESRWS